MRIESEFDFCDVTLTNEDGAVCFEDETGDAVYLDSKMLKEILPALQHFVDTGALPE